MNPSEQNLTDALRRVTALAPDGPSAGLGQRLMDEFHRHHARRRRIRIAQASMIAACVAASVAIFFIFLRPAARDSGSGHQRHEVGHSSAPVQAVLASPAIAEQSGKTVVKARKVSGPAKSRRVRSAEPEHFVTLPTFDPAIPIDHLEMVRVDLPGRALRLVGFSVSEEIAERRVMADVLLTQDGTPYALRVVHSSQTKEF